MIYDGDIDDFFSTDEFAQTVTYKAGGTGSGVSISAIVDEPGQQRVVNGMLITTTARQVTVKTSDVSSPSMSDTVTIDGTEYDVTGYKPDGTGFTVLILTSDGR